MPIEKTDRGDAMAEAIIEGRSQESVAKMFGVSKIAVHQACSRRGVRCLGANKRAALLDTLLRASDLADDLLQLIEAETALDDPEVRSVIAELKDVLQSRSVFRRTATGGADDDRNGG